MPTFGVAYTASAPSAADAIAKASFRLSEPSVVTLTATANAAAIATINLLYALT